MESEITCEEINMNNVIMNTPYSLTEFLIVIGSPCTYLSSNQRTIT